MKATPLYKETCLISSFQRERNIFLRIGNFPKINVLPGRISLYPNRLDVMLLFFSFASIKIADIENIEIHKSLLGARVVIFSKISDIVVGVSIGHPAALEMQLRRLDVKVS